MDELGFTRVTEKDQLLVLAHKIKPDLPHCASMYNSLLLLGRGHCSQGQVYVPSNHPDSHVVTWIKTEPYTQALFFCREHEVDHLTKALRATPLVDWQNLQLMYFIPPYLLGQLQVLAKDLGLDRCPIFTHIFTYHPDLDTGSLRCGAGLRVCRLGKAGVQRLLKTNKYTKNDPLGPMWRYVQTVPAVGVYLDSSVTEDAPVDLDDLPCAGDEDLPVSWVTTTSDGFLGRLKTQEEYRRRGLGSLIVRVGARLMADQGYIPHACVESDNSDSLAMFRNTPYWINTHNMFWLVTKSDL